MGSARFWKLSPINLGVGLLCFKENPLLQWKCGTVGYGIGVAGREDQLTQQNHITKRKKKVCSITKMEP